MSTYTSGSDDSNSDFNNSDPDYVPPRRSSLESPGENRRNTRSRTRNLGRRSSSLNTLISLINFEDNTSILKPIITMTNKATPLSLDTAINLVPKFNGEEAGEIYPFLDTCSFVIRSVSEESRPTLLQAIISKLSGKAYAAVQHREITTWESAKGLLEITFCAKRTPGYLQLELSAMRHKNGETVQEYSARVEKTLHELCNVSASNISAADAKAVHRYIKQVTLTSYIEGLPSSIKNVIKSKNYETLEEAIKNSLEEDKIYQSNKDSQKIFHNKSMGNNVINKYCKNCKRNNHSTAECRYARRTIDTGQRSYARQTVSNTNMQSKFCSYCKIKGHTIEECYKKRNSDARKGNQNDQASTSGNGKEPGKMGVRPVRELKIITQN